jgi:hypothetical protein
MIYIMLGSTNADSGLCEVSFGTSTSGDCTNTRTLDTTGAASTWSATTEDESNTFGHTYYPLDNDADANVEEASATIIRYDITSPPASGVTSAFFAHRITTGTGITQQLGLRDFSAFNTANGGFTTVGTTVVATTSYQDNVTVATVTTGGYLGTFSNAISYQDTSANRMTHRFQTTASGTTTNNAVNQIDFAFASLGWTEPSIITAGTTGTQRVTIQPSTTDNNMTAAFTLVRDNGTTNITSITVAELGTITANTELSGADMYYETSATCTYDGTETQFGTTATFDSNQEAVFTGTMAVGTSQVCVYILLDTGAATLGDTIELQLSVPRDDVVAVNGSVSPATAVAMSGTTTVSNNTAPDDPTGLGQEETDDTAITTGGWINATSVRFFATADDPDGSDTLQLCIEADPTGTGFSNTEDSCGSGVGFSGTPVTVEHTIAGLTDATAYHWQARVKDAAGAYSNWISFGGNAESATDFGIDTTAPTGGIVYDGDGTGVDVEFNDGSLADLSANWTFDSTASGIDEYEYSIGITPGGTTVRNWTTTGSTPDVDATGLTLQTSQLYYFNVRATDNAGNVSGVVSSDGIAIAPTLTFALSNSSISFTTLSAGNGFSDTKSSTITTSTNAYNGYVVRAYKTDAMRSLLYPATTIADFNAGTYAAPSEWTLSNYGFGYTSSDATIQGSSKFPAAGACPGSGTAPCYAPFSSSSPGDIVADHTTNVAGSPISNQQFTFTYKVQTTQVQPAGGYATTVVYTVVPQY